MNPGLQRLRAYPFERLAALKAGVRPPAQLAHIPLSIGEPRHAPPAFVLEALQRSLGELGNYPATRGLPGLRAAAAQWLTRRFALAPESVDPERMVLPVNGTREALFAIVQATVDTRHAKHGKALVAMPNPFYQIYEGAALLAGAEPYYLNATAENGYLPDLHVVPHAVWQRCQLLFLCSPGNPAGAVMQLDYLRRVLDLAERHDFIVACDECYADLYLDESRPPPSLLRAARESGNASFSRCIVFHSLSKRSSLPGLRSGFVAGCPQLMQRFLLYRTYQGCAMSAPTQHASIAAWSEDSHASDNRALYREKFRQVVPLLQPLLDVAAPEGGFYLWARVSEAGVAQDELFVRDLYAEQNVTVVPGSYLAREAHGVNPGAGRVRISLVASLDECVAAALRIRDFAAQRSRA